MTDMHTYLIRPGAPLVFRSGKPFGTGSRDGANFPWPSSLAGAMRTAWWDANNGTSAPAELAQLQQQMVAGPLLALLNGTQTIPLVPKPADAVYLKENDSDKALTRVYRLQPKTLDTGVGINLPENLLPMQLTETDKKGKPQPGPRFWTLTQLLDWQQQKPNLSDDLAALRKCESLSDGPSHTNRTHLAINNDTRAAEEGKLFQTQGLVFGSAPGNRQEYALLVRYAMPVQNGPIILGGERRMSWLETAQKDLLEPQRAHLSGLASAKGVVLHLLTPALFSGGWKPGWLNEQLIGSPPGLEGKLTLKLVAACLERWEPFSGWDLAKSQPRAARKLAAAGSSYWFEILDQQGQSTASLWLASICDNPQDQRNGFGLVIPGPYHF